MGEIEACGSIVILITTYYVIYHVVGDFIDVVYKVIDNDKDVE